MENETFETKVEVDRVYAKLFAKEAAPFVFTTTALMLTQVVAAALFALTLYFFVYDIGNIFVKLSPIVGVLFIELLSVYLYRAVVKRIENKFLGLLEKQDKIFYTLKIDNEKTIIENSQTGKPLEFSNRTIKKYHETDNFIIIESGRSKLFGFYKELDPDRKVKKLISGRISNNI